MSAEMSINKQGQVEQTNLESLRGSNPTQQILNLIEKYVRDVAVDEWTGNPSNKEFFTQILSPVLKLQKWATSIDREIVKTAASVKPTDQASLERMVSNMIRERAIFGDLALIGNDGILLLLSNRARQWHLIKALFEIDTSGLKLGRQVVFWNRPHLFVAHSYPAFDKSPTVDLTDVHEIMFHLISSATQERGEVKDMTTPENITRRKKVHSAPTVIGGVSAIITTNDYGVTRGYGENGVNGCPNLYGLTLKLEPSILASIRPLADNDYRRYVPKAKEERLERIWRGEEPISTPSQGKTERPSAQRIYEQRYVQELAAIRGLRRNFRGTDTEWTNMCPPDGLVPPWIWWDVYHGR